MNLINYLIKDISEIYKPFTNRLRRHWDNFTYILFEKPIFETPLFRGKLFYRNPMTREDKKRFTASLGKTITDFFDVVYTSWGMKWVRKQNRPLEALAVG